MARSCGSCSLCCKVMAVTELGKPRNVWCASARPGSTLGCGIHGTPARPQACSDFLCAWVEREVLPVSLRPDIVHAFFQGLKDGSGMAVHVDPGYPNAWKEEPLRSYIDRFVREGMRVIVAVGARRHMLLGREWVSVIDEASPA